MNTTATEDKINKAFDILSTVNRQAYKDPYLISNQVLSKNPFNNNFLNRFLKDDDPGLYPVTRFIGKLAIYYAKTSVHFFMYLLRALEYFLSFFRFRYSGEKKELILIDICFIIEKIRAQKTFSDIYFPGLEDELKKKSKHFAYIPFFYSASYNKKPLEFYTALQILKEKKVPVLCEFQLLTLSDMVRLFYFVLTYPLHVIRFAMGLNKDAYETRLLAFELMDTLDHVTIYNFSRYLQGRRIASMPYERIKIISWYENQPIHKNLYKGLRTRGSKVKIYGAQLFLYPKEYLYIIPDENEDRFGLIPDRVIVSGPFYLPERGKLNFTVGPSLRSAKIFNIVIDKKHQKDVLVVLPSFDDDARNILRALPVNGLSGSTIFIKAHHAIPIERYKDLIPSSAKVIDGDIYKLFKTTKIVISAASGILIEAASLGIPSIVVKNTTRFDYNNFLLGYGKGVIWEEASGPREVIDQIKRIEHMLKHDANEIKMAADEYRKNFFCKPTDRNIDEAFDLSAA